MNQAAASTHVFSLFRAQFKLHLDYGAEEFFLFIDILLTDKSA